MSMAPSAQCFWMSSPLFWISTKKFLPKVLANHSASRVASSSWSLRITSLNSLEAQPHRQIRPSLWAASSSLSMRGT